MTPTIRSLNHEFDRHQNTFAISWIYHTVCNYSCTYCIPKLYDGAIKGPSLDAAIRFVDKVIAAKKDKHVFFELSGGEITYLSHFKELFGHIRAKGAYTGIISNGSRPSAWWNEHAHLINHACLTFHVERGDKEKFYDVIQTLYGKVDLHINMMMAPEHFGDLLSFAQKLASEFEHLPIALQPIFENFSGPMYPYTAEQKQILESPQLPYHANLKHRFPTEVSFPRSRGTMVQVNSRGDKTVVDANNLIARQENRWKKWECSVGIESLIVEANGFIFRSYCGVEGVIGNIHDEHFNFPERPVICLANRCTCAFDIMTTKKNIFNLPTVNV